MIADHDRSGWFGASDTAMIMGNWKTKTFRKWWQQKLGIDQSHFTNTSMLAGTHYEHAILQVIGAAEMDRQILIPELRLRVNLDGNTGCRIHEVKTYKLDGSSRKGTALQNRGVEIATSGLEAPPRNDIALVQAGRGWKPTKAYMQQVQVQMYAVKQVWGGEVSAEIVAYGLTEAEYRNFFLEIDPRRILRFPVEYDEGFLQAYLPRLRYLAGCLEKGVWPDEIAC